MAKVFCVQINFTIALKIDLEISQYLFPLDMAAAMEKQDEALQLETVDLETPDIETPESKRYSLDSVRREAVGGHSVANLPHVIGCGELSDCNGNGILSASSGEESK
jgi:hypothetical protein